MIRILKIHRCQDCPPELSDMCKYKSLAGTIPDPCPLPIAEQQKPKQGDTIYIAGQKAKLA